MNRSTKIRHPLAIATLNSTNHRLLSCGSALALVTWFCLTVSPASAGEWMTWRSTYTHDQSGQRVDQHTAPVEPLSPDQGNLVRSGFRHYRSTIQGSTTADNLNITHEWGRPVMPYEHWRFPFRPYGTPYPQWGPPVPNVLNNFNVPNNFGRGPSPGFGPGFMPNNANPFQAGGNANGFNGNGFNGNRFNGNGFNGNGAMPGGGAIGTPGWGYPGAGYPYPTMPNPSAPWVDGLYPSAPPMGR